MPLLDGLLFVGVPTLPVDEKVRDALEQAWFEHRPLMIQYRSANETITSRKVRLQSVVMERSITLLNCKDLDKDEARQFRLDRVETATICKEE